MQDNNGRRVINIIFRVIIIGAFYTGIKAVYNFYMLMAQYPTLKGESLFSIVALLIDDYMFMIILTVAAIIFNILANIPGLSTRDIWILNTLSFPLSKKGFM